MMTVHPSGYYAWKAEPASPSRKDDQRLLGLIKQSWLESGGVYGYRKITHDLRDLGERCGKHRVYRLMKQEGLKASSPTAIATSLPCAPTITTVRLFWSIDLTLP